jgi:hypothetical protein
MALFDRMGGLLGNLGDYGFGLPSNTGGLVADEDRDAINKRALLSGLISAGLTYAATPKNLNTGSALPYLGKAGLAGFNTSQDVVDRALNTAYRNKILAGRDDNIRTIKQDRFEITQERQPDGSYKEIGRSALDAPITEKPLDIERLVNLRDKLKQENPNNPNIAIYDDIIKNKRTTKEGFNINLGSPVAGLNEQGEPVFFQPSKTGGVPSIVPNIRPIQEPKPPTEEQSKARTFFKRMEGSTKVFNQPAVDAKGNPILDANGNPLTIEQVAGKPEIGAEIAGAIPLIGGVAQRGAESTNRQLYRQAQENWVTANLRKESGAVIGEQEFDREIKKYFPQIGEGPEVIAQKAESRRIAEEGMKSNANFPTQKTTEPEQTAQPTQKAQPKQTSAKGLKVGQVVNGFKYLGGDPNNQNSWSK